jgi:hypothetical protein
MFFLYYRLQFFLWLKIAIQGTLGTKHVKYQGTLSNILPKRYPWTGLKIQYPVI